MEWFTRPLLQKRMMCILKKKRRSAMALINERQNCFRERKSGKKQKKDAERVGAILNNGPASLPII